MSPIGLIIALLVVGGAAWLLDTDVPMDVKISQIINVLVVICVLQVFGVLGSLQNIRIR